MSKRNNDVTPRVRYSYGDFRPVRRGEAAYSPTARRYVSAGTGQIIGVREFQKQARGGVTYAQKREAEYKVGIQPRIHTPKYIAQAKREHLFQEYAHNVREKMPHVVAGISDAQLRAGPEFKLLLLYLKSPDTSPTGRKAQALVLLGRRQPSWSWNVGDSEIQ